MTKNPIINALAAVGYICIVASVMFYGSQYKGPDNSIFAPIAFISVFTLSAAVMGYLFLSQPLLMYFEGKKKEAVNLFLQTLMAFAVLTATILSLYFSGILY